MKNICKNMKQLLPNLKPLKAPSGLSKQKQKDMLYKMCAIRAFDSRVKDLWMANEIYASKRPECADGSSCSCLRVDRKRPA